MSHEFETFHFYHNGKYNMAITYGLCYTESCLRKVGTPASYWAGPFDI